MGIFMGDSLQKYARRLEVYSSGEVHRLTTPDFNTSGLLDPGRKIKEGF
jgi:hypothetical protein